MKDSRRLTTTAGAPIADKPYKSKPERKGEQR
jgi:hypothetical protein